jgi:hypothetical protein
MSDYSKSSRTQLLALCKEKGIKGYSTKKKDELLALLATQQEPQPTPAHSMNKKTKGQFYTTNSAYILDGFSIPQQAQRIMEPFAGQGDLLDWISTVAPHVKPEAYDIEPKREGIIQRDTLKTPPDYKDAWIITNPPYLARNKSKSKEIYDQYDTNDLYKCFISSVSDQATALGGIFIIPAGFFLSPRDLDVKCRAAFMTKYKLLKVRYFEETVFDDTTTTIVAVAFEKSPTPLEEQEVEWELYPSKEKKTFKMEAKYDWIIGGEIYNLPIPQDISIRRHVEGLPLKDGEQQTFMTLNALDSGRKEGRIALEYKKDYVYPAKDCSRTYATLRITGRQLTEEEQKQTCKEFNELIEDKREKTCSLFLPQFRESKEYARKRIPFELAYRIVLHILK